jgi:hypothetical protein
MHPLQVSAQFAAFLWFCDRSQGAVDKAEAHRFARENWLRFLSHAHEGWGKLLIQVAKVWPDKGRRVRRRHAERTPPGIVPDMAEAGSSCPQGKQQGGSAVYHTIQFAVNFVADLKPSSKQPLERVRICKGERIKAQVRPHVVETKDGPVEVADLFFEDGTATRNVPFAYFAFVE